MKLKPIPKLILIIAVVGGIGYGVNLYLESQPKQAEQPVAVQQATQPEPVQQTIQQPQQSAIVQEPQQVQQVQQVQPISQSGQIEQDNSTNAGFAKLLQGKK
jgi:hypothetical protein